MRTLTSSSAVALGPAEAYVSEIRKKFRNENTTEHSFRSALQEFVESLDESVDATNEPKRVKCGAPDYVVTRKRVPLGYVEAKDLGVDLDEVENSEQLVRYRNALGNLILTNYLEFRWYVAGDLRLTISLGRVKRGKLEFSEENFKEVTSLLKNFLNCEAKTIGTPEELARRLALTTQSIRDLILRTFEDEEESKWLESWLKAFRQVLIKELSQTEFADMFAQTMAYGLFAARIHHTNNVDFSRFSAAKILPKTNPFLKRLFAQFAGVDMPETINWAVDEIVETLKRVDMDKLRLEFGKDSGKDDPIIHFYETFLSAYNPDLKQKRGVYYTPKPAVDFVVRAIDEILVREFKRKDGLADPSTLILDPAVGTGSFLHSIVDNIHQKYEKRPALWDAYVEEKLLDRLFGFEILMAPYSVAHLKLGLQLQQSGYQFGKNQRLGVYLTNTLEEAAKKSDELLFEWVSDEANAASKLKRDTPIMVVLGNPPYSGHSANKGDWIQELIETYKEGCPELHKPGQAKWLSDDYVKFIRFAQWRVNKTGFGVVAFVTNHSFLENPTFRGMRRSLMNDFDSIYLMDLHGDKRKREENPDGGEDENIFDIQQGVSICLMVRKENADETRKPAQVYRCDVWGSRAEKYDWLKSHDFSKIDFEELKPSSPQFIFSAQDERLRSEYDTHYSLPEIFNQNGDPAPGLVTTHDEFAVSFSEKESKEKIEQFLATKTETEAREVFKLCSQDQWNYSKAKKELATGAWKKEITKILYRPFDCRYTVLDRNVAVHRRERITSHMLHKNNLGFVSARSNKSPTPDHFFVSKFPTEAKTGESTTQSCLFPLYLHDSDDLFGKGKTRINIDPELLKQVPIAGKAEDQAESLFAYLYGISYAPSYRRRFGAFLKTDYPRIPIVTERPFFATISELGKKLIDLHTSDDFAGKGCGTFEVRGSNEVECNKFNPDEECVYINDSQCFGSVTKEVWEFSVGGYQVVEKLLKSRRDRRLTLDEIEHICRVIGVIKETLNVMQTLDEKIKKNGGWPLKHCFKRKQKGSASTDRKPISIGELQERVTTQARGKSKKRVAA